MNTDQETTTEAPGSSRRALLKGAVAVGVGAAVYTAPIVGTVPAYATHGLNSVDFSSSLYCVWFSPNHQSNLGDWHTDTGGTASAVPGFPDHSLTGSNVQFNFNVPVTGYTATPVTVIMQGNPNNSSFAVLGNFTVQGWNGGGVRLRLNDNKCEMEVITLTCTSKCGSQDSGEDTPSSFTNGSSKIAITSIPLLANRPSLRIGPAGGRAFQGGGNVYYHTEARDHDGAKGRCKFSMTFRINCTK